MNLRNKLYDAEIAITDAKSELAMLRHQCANIQEIIDAIAGRSGGGNVHSIRNAELDGLQMAVSRINKTINRS